MENFDNLNLVKEEIEELIAILKNRFEENMHRHKDLDWGNVEKRIESDKKIIETLYKMEKTGGQPDVIAYNKENDKYTYCDCSKESPDGRRSLCYDLDALEKRKKNKPEGDAHTYAEKIGIKILNEDQYRKLQELGDFDFKSSSWIETPESMRTLGGGLFGDKRYDRTFIYHNGVESYYASRGFRGYIII